MIARSHVSSLNQTQNVSPLNQTPLNVFQNQSDVNASAEVTSPDVCDDVYIDVD